MLSSSLSLAISSFPAAIFVFNVAISVSNEAILLSGIVAFIISDVLTAFLNVSNKFSSMLTNLSVCSV